MDDSKDPRDYGWKEHEGKLIAMWFQGGPLPTLKKLVLQGVINGNLNLASTFKLKISCEIQDKKHFDRLSN